MLYFANTSRTSQFICKTNTNGMYLIDIYISIFLIRIFLKNLRLHFVLLSLTYFIYFSSNTILGVRFPPNVPLYIQN